MCDFRQQFLRFSQETLFGIAMEQSKYYDNQVWKHHDIGRGFNSGVVFWKLDRARSLGWSTFWWPETQKAMKALGWENLELGDQAVFNLLVHVDAIRVHVLPCAFNVQLHDPHRGSVCLHRSITCLILHGNANSFHEGGHPVQGLLSLFADTNPSDIICKERGNVQHLVHQFASHFKPPHSSSL